MEDLEAAFRLSGAQRRSKVPSSLTLFSVYNYFNIFSFTLSQISNTIRYTVTQLDLFVFNSDQLFKKKKKEKFIENTARKQLAGQQRRGRLDRLYFFFFLICVAFTAVLTLSLPSLPSPEVFSLLKLMHGTPMLLLYQFSAEKSLYEMCPFEVKLA